MILKLSSYGNLKFLRTSLLYLLYGNYVIHITVKSFISVIDLKDNY